MNSYSKIQKCLSLFMFITINIFFYFKYLSKISVVWGIVSCFVYLVAILLVIKYRPTLKRKTITTGLIAFIITAAILLFFIPKELFTADRWLIIDLFWDSVSNQLYPYAQQTAIGNSPGAMPFYFLLCLPFHGMGEIGFITLVAIALMALYFYRKPVQNYSLFFIFLISSACIYWEIFSRSTLLINATLFTFFLFWLTSYSSFSTRTWICSAIVGGLLFSTRTVFVLPLVVWGLYQIFTEKVPLFKIILWGVIFLLAFAATFLPFIMAYPHEFWEINPFLIQSTLVPSVFIVIFVILAAIGSFFCRNVNDVNFFSAVLLFGIVTVHVITSACRYGFEAIIFESKADISYYLFCIPYLLQILTSSNIAGKENIYTPTRS